MNIKLINRGQEGELLLEGRLDSLTAPEAEEVFNQTAERFDKVILNMRDLEYVSSAGLRTLKRLHMAMKKKNGNLTNRVDSTRISRCEQKFINVERRQ